MRKIVITVLLTLLAGLATTNAQTDTEIAKHIEERQRLIAKLVAQVTAKTTGVDVKLNAIRTLGELRAVDAVRVLVDLIDTPTDEPINSLGGSLGQLFPAITALIQIGKPSVSPCVDQLMKPAAASNGFDMRKGIMLCFVIRGVEGEDVGRLILENKLADILKQKGRSAEQQAANLKRAIAEWFASDSGR